MRKAAAGALLCLCLAGAAPGRAQEKNSLLRPLGVVALDGWHLLSSPLRIRSSHLPALATAGLATGATYAQDGSVRRRVAEDPGAWGRGAADELSNFVRFKPVLLYNASLIGLGAGWRYLHPDSRLLSAAWVSLEAQMFSALFTQGIKGFTGRQRPNPEISGSRNLRFFRGGQSFSSGHAAWAFSTASVFAYQYGAPVGWLAYGTAAGISLSRVALDKHHASDVLVGALLGTSVGLALSRRHLDPTPLWGLSLFSVEGGQGLGFHIRF